MCLYQPVIPIICLFQHQRPRDPKSSRSSIHWASGVCLPHGRWVVPHHHFLSRDPSEAELLYSHRLSYWSLMSFTHCTVYVWNKERQDCSQGCVSTECSYRRRASLQDLLFSAISQTVLVMYYSPFSMINKTANDSVVPLSVCRCKNNLKNLSEGLG